MTRKKSKKKYSKKVEKRKWREKEVEQVRGRELIGKVVSKIERQIR